MTNLLLSALSLLIALLFAYLSYLIIKRWSKLLKTAFGALLKVFFLLCLIPLSLLLFFATYYCIINYWEEDHVRELTEFEEIKLGWSREELLFRFGKPISESVHEKGLDGFRTEFLVFENDKSITVELKENKVVSIDNDCRRSYDKLGGIRCGASVETLINKYGNPKKLEISHNNLARLYNYPRYNLTYLLNNGKVSRLLLNDKAYYPDGSKFHTAEEINEIKAKEEKKLMALPPGYTLEEPKKSNLPTGEIVWDTAADNKVKKKKE